MGGLEKNGDVYIQPSSTYTSDSGGGVVITTLETVPYKTDNGPSKATTIWHTMLGLTEEANT